MSYIYGSENNTQKFCEFSFVPTWILFTSKKGKIKEKMITFNVSTNSEF